MKKIIITFLIATLSLMAVEFKTINAMNEVQLQTTFLNMNTAEEWIEYFKVAMKLNDEFAKIEDTNFIKINDILNAASAALNKKECKFSEKKNFAKKIIDNVSGIYIRFDSENIRFVLLMNPITVSLADSYKTNMITKGTGTISQGSSKE